MLCLCLFVCYFVLQMLIGARTAVVATVPALQSFVMYGGLAMNLLLENLFLSRVAFVVQPMLTRARKIFRFSLRLNELLRRRRMMVLNRVVPNRVALSRVVLSRVAPSRVALSRVALSRVVLSRVALSRVALSRVVLSRVALSRVAFKCVCTTFACLWALIQMDHLSTL